MKAVFVELPSFNKYRSDYLVDDEYQSLQRSLLESPSMGDVIQGTGGLRKIRWVDKNRNKGKRGGIRIIYYWYDGGSQFWFFTIFDKNEASDITPDQKKILKKMLEAELASRKE
ncbi:MAG: hypothetical protein ACJAW8_000494 [Oleispira sp.]